MAYTVPAAADLKLRYPAFANVDDAVADYWITDAQRFVDTSWSEGDYAAALIALAAHNIAMLGLGMEGAALAGVPAGITQMRSGSLSLGFTPEAANARLAGDYTATRYGQEFARLLQLNKGGPRVTDTGTWPADPYFAFGFPVPPFQ